MQFLFERLERVPLPTGAPCPPFDLRAAVRTQIERIVSARLPHGGDAGGALAATQFGMPSVVELGCGDTHILKAYAARLTRMLRLYEPRLLQPAVVLLPSGDGMAPYALVVQGRLASDAQAQVHTFALYHRQVRP